MAKHRKEFKEDQNWHDLARPDSDFVETAGLAIIAHIRAGGAFREKDPVTRLANTIRELGPKATVPLLKSYVGLLGVTDLPSMSVEWTVHPPLVHPAILRTLGRKLRRARKAINKRTEAKQAKPKPVPEPKIDPVIVEGPWKRGLDALAQFSADAARAA